MRIKELYIKGFKNLKEFKIDFDTKSPYTLLVGRNGTGKSNLLEAITRIFRDLDLRRISDFYYRIAYEINGREVVIDYGSEWVEPPGPSGMILKPKPLIYIDGKQIRTKVFYRKEAYNYLPKHVFGYYSGTQDRFKDVFKTHLIRYRDALIANEEGTIRRLFRAENAHSQFVLLAFYAQKREIALKFLKEYFGIKKFHSALFVFNEPHWKPSKPSKIHLVEGDERFWWARGKVKELMAVLHDVSLAPMSQDIRVDVGLKRQKKKEHKFYYIKDLSTLRDWTKDLDQKEFFKLLESSLLSDLLKEVRIKFELETGEKISFTELSEGEQQLLTVLGLLKFTNQDESLFLLDEPDTHLNPAWSLDYLSLLKKYSGGMKNSQIVMTTHDPLVITNLERQQVRLLYFDDNKEIYSMPPEEDLRGMGVNALLESELFGLRSTLGANTLDKIEARNRLFAKDNRTEEEEYKLTKLSTELADIGILTSFRDPTLNAFAKAYARRQKKFKQVLTKEELEHQEEIADEILDEIYEEYDS